MNILGNIMLMEKTNNCNFNVEIMKKLDRNEQIYNCSKLTKKIKKRNYFYKNLVKMKAKLLMMYQLVIRYENQN